MLASEIRKRYLEFFEKKGHTVVGSDLLVPKGDPTLLFTGAGMNQFKDQFMGKNIIYKRAVSCQKCLRTGDLENVGRTPRHHTFFEMLGNFSFGDYFKKEAIAWGWEFMTEEMGISPERLWISVYTDDEESYLIWRDEVKVPAERIVKLGAKDNFWPADAPSQGPNGPCGPCSEIFYDWGEKVGCGKPECGPDCGCGRFVEVWNLVFTEFERKPDGSLVPLPNKNIDTGMGLERMASVMQAVPTNFQTDLFRPLIDHIKRELGDVGAKVPMECLYLMADHIRAATFSIADGVSPSNEKRGYVVRKLIRRAYLKSGKKEPFLYNVVPKVADLMKDVYPEIEEKREHISAIVEEEEKRFNDTLEAAIPVFEDMISDGRNSLDGEQVFKLVDTYGLPLEVIEETAEEKGVGLDMEGFLDLMEERKEESRKGSDISAEFIFQPDHFRDAPNPESSDDMPLDTTLAFILKKGKESDEALSGERAEIITSPQSGDLYTEAGGQVGDTGTITKDGGLIEVLNTYDAGGRKVMEVSVAEGSFKKGDKVVLDIDRERKQRTAMNHTATHLLQAALRKVLGDHVRQSGSLVDDKHLRFDWTHMKKRTDRELRKVEDTMNGWVEDALPVCKEEKSLKEAQEEGALSFFGEKYGEIVRIVSVSDISKELCGGTHLDNTADIGIVKIVHESSVASGIRRIEVKTGMIAKHWIREKLHDLLEEYKAYSKGLEDIEEGVAGLKEAVSKAEGVVKGDVDVDKDIMYTFEDSIMPAFMKAKEFAGKAEKKKKKAQEADVFAEVKAGIDRIVGDGSDVSGMSVVSGAFPGAGMPVLRKGVGYAEKKIGSGVVLLGGSGGDKAFLVCSVSKDLSEKGISARDIMEKAATSIQGKGGGSETFAQAGGSDPSGLEDAVREGRRIIEEKGVQ